MNLSTEIVESLAAHLDDCMREARDTTKITDRHPEMDWDDAYAVQDAIRRRQLARGARIVGYKAGLTSHAKMRQMGVDTPVFGFLTDVYDLPEGGECNTAELIHPKVEPEIAFVTKAELKGPGCHIGAVLAATDFVIAGIEVIDSRYRDFKFDLKAWWPTTRRRRVSSRAAARSQWTASTCARSASCSRRTGGRSRSARARPCLGIRPPRSRCSRTISARAANRFPPAA